MSTYARENNETTENEISNDTDKFNGKLTNLFKVIRKMERFRIRRVLRGKICLRHTMENIWKTKYKRQKLFEMLTNLKWWKRYTRIKRRRGCPNRKFHCPWIISLLLIMKTDTHTTIKKYITQNTLLTIFINTFCNIHDIHFT